MLPRVRLVFVVGESQSQNGNQYLVRSGGRYE
jgi:hypothetical protein